MKRETAAAEESSFSVRVHFTGEGTCLQQSLTSSDCKRLNGAVPDNGLRFKAKGGSKSSPSRSHPISSPLKMYFIKLAIINVVVVQE